MVFEVNRCENIIFFNVLLYDRSELKATSLSMLFHFNEMLMRKNVNIYLFTYFANMFFYLTGTGVRFCVLKKKPSSIDEDTVTKSLPHAYRNVQSALSHATPVCPQWADKQVAHEYICLLNPCGPQTIYLHVG